MKILPINVQSSNSKHTKLSSDNNKSQAFKARLLVQNSANNVGLKNLVNVAGYGMKLLNHLKRSCAMILLNPMT